MVQTEVKKSGWHAFAAHSRFLCCIQMLTGRESMAPLCCAILGVFEPGPLLFAAQTQPRPENAMEGNCGGVRPRRIDQLSTVQMGEGALDGAARQACGRRDGLMRQADRPMGLLAGLTIKVKVNDVRGQTAVMAHQVGQKGVEQIGVHGYLGHRAIVINDIANKNASWAKCLGSSFSLKHIVCRLRAVVLHNGVPTRKGES
jgi:hypothetical protein